MAVNTVVSTLLTLLAMATNPAPTLHPDPGSTPTPQPQPHPNPNPNLNPNSNPNQPKDECAAGSAGDGAQDRTGAKELPTAPAAGRRRKFSLPSLRGRRAS